MAKAAADVERVWNTVCESWRQCQRSWRSRSRITEKTSPAIDWMTALKSNSSRPLKICVVQDSSQRICRRLQQASFLKPRLHDTTIVNPVVKPVWQPAVSCKRGWGFEISAAEATAVARIIQWGVQWGVYQSVCEFFHGHIDARRLTNQLSMMQDVCNREAYWHSLPDFGKRDNVHWLAIFRRQRYHGLRGSASPVLTATGLVNGRWRFSTPYRIDTP